MVHCFVLCFVSRFWDARFFWGVPVKSGCDGVFCSFSLSGLFFFSEAAPSLCLFPVSLFLVFFRVTCFRPSPHPVEPPLRSCSPMGVPFFCWFFRFRSGNGGVVFVRDVSSAKSLGVWRVFWGVPRVLTRPSVKNRSGVAFCGCLRGSFCPAGFGCSVGMLFRSFTRLTDCHGLGGI